jgi:DNA-binding protein HU-beta
MFSLSDLGKEVHSRIDQVEGVPALKKSGVFDILRAAFEIIGQAVASGEEVSVPQFGKFIPVDKPARTGRNPHTGDAIEIPAKKVIKFRPSSVLKTVVAGAEPSVPKKKEAKKEKKAKKK